MLIAISLSVILFCAYLLLRARTAYRETTTPSDFLSFGSIVDNATLQRTFEASNASFATAFIALHLYAFSLGPYAIVVPLAFCLGIVFFVFVLLPRKLDALSMNARYPAVIGEAARSPALRKLAAGFVIFSLWLFTYSEIQGLHLFFASLYASVPWVVPAIPILLIAVIAFYTTLGGYRAILLTDRVQMYVIYAGSAVVFIASLALLNKSGFTASWNAATAAAQKAFASKPSAVMFVVDTLVGFCFSQLLYYDNWQRLSFFVSETRRRERWSSDQVQQHLTFLSRRIRHSYLIGSVVLLVVYSMPILLGYAFMGAGRAASFDVLAALVSEVWLSIPVIGWIGAVLIVLQFVAALMSTADTYLIGATNVVYEDLAGRSLSSSGQEEANARNASRMTIGPLRAIAAAFCASFLLLVLIHPDFETLFLYMFYSANGFVGPILFAASGRRIRASVVVAVLLFGFAYPAVPILFPNLASYCPYPGIVPVVISLLAIGVTSPKSGAQELST